MSHIILEIAKYAAVFLSGAMINRIFLVSKLDALTKRLEELVEQVREMSIRYKTVDKLVDKYINLEERLSTTEAKLEVLEKWIDRVEQEITK